MTFTRQQPDLAGTGLLGALTSPGGEGLTFSGTRRADTLDITYVRVTGGSFHFAGWFVAGHAGIAGTLNGGEFVNQSVSFRRY